MDLNHLHVTPISAYKKFINNSTHNCKFINISAHNNRFIQSRIGHFTKYLLQPNHHSKSHQIHKLPTITPKATRFTSSPRCIPQPDNRFNVTSSWNHQHHYMNRVKKHVPSDMYSKINTQHLLKPLFNGGSPVCKL